MPIFQSFCKDIWRSILFTCLAALVGSGSGCAASAETVNLACGGVFHLYEPERMDSSVAPTASAVDLASKKITTPLGEYRISRVDEEQLTFGAPAAPGFNFVTHGTLDRLSGRMLIRWFRPEEDAKAQVVGQSANMARYAEFTCAAAKRLF